MPGEARPFDMQSGGTSAGSESPIFAGRIEKFLFGSTRELNIPISSAAYESPIGFDYVDSGSTSHPKCRSLNKRRLPRLVSPGETLRQRVDLIVVPARK
jgi:hypothetical protein